MCWSTCENERSVNRTARRDWCCEMKYSTLRHSWNDDVKHCSASIMQESKRIRFSAPTFSHLETQSFHLEFYSCARRIVSRRVCVSVHVTYRHIRTTGAPHWGQKERSMNSRRNKVLSRRMSGTLKVSSKLCRNNVNNFDWIVQQETTSEHTK